MNPAEIARRLDRRFRLLTRGERVAVERHQTLRATVDWSYDLLSKPEQRLLARLAVFAGGCTLEAAEQVCRGGPVEGDDVFEHLAALVARSLVVADSAGLQTRYRLLETIRQYGEEHLVEAGEVEVLHLAHARYYACFLGRCRATFTDRVPWSGRSACRRTRQSHSSNGLRGEAPMWILLSISSVKSPTRQGRPTNCCFLIRDHS